MSSTSINKNRIAVVCVCASLLHKIALAQHGDIQRDVWCVAQQWQSLRATLVKKIPQTCILLVLGGSGAVWTLGKANPAPHTSQTCNRRSFRNTYEICVEF